MLHERAGTRCENSCENIRRRGTRDPRARGRAPWAGRALAGEGEGKEKAWSDLGARQGVNLYVQPLPDE